MFKKSVLFFIILTFALLSIGIASAEDGSSLELTDTNVDVSTDVMNDTNTEVIASEYGKETSLDITSKDDDSTQSQKDIYNGTNENTLGVQSSNIDKTVFSENNLITNSNNELILNEKTPVATTNEANRNFTELQNAINGVGGLIFASNYKMTDSESASFTNGITISKDIDIMEMDLLLMQVN